MKIRRRIGLFIGLGLAGVLLCIGAFPLATRQGINYQVSVHRIPLFVKGLEFVLRDIQLAHLAASITGGIQGEEKRAVALFHWTRERIRPTPPGFPVVDDHITHIIIRGYGEADQMADVFTALSTYAGLPAFWRTARSKSKQCSVILSFVQVDRKWTVWDVAHGVTYRNQKGALASVEELAGNSDLEGLAPFAAPEPLRARKQMLFPRIFFEIRRSIFR